MNPSVRQAVFEMFGGRCAYCGRELTSGPKGDSAYQADHLHPKYLGGSDGIENRVPACRLCNYYKRTLSVEQFREQLALIPGRLERQANYRLAVAHGLIIPVGKTPTFLLEGDTNE